jgi:hypothetical protein
MSVSSIAVRVTCAFVVACVWGCSGADGAEGVAGPPGESGADGANGEDGAIGQDGAPGETGAQGEDGAPGENGAKGEEGAKGEDGAPGENGAKGNDGVKGEDGAPGENGAKGDDGEPGAKGDDGDDGESGANGKTSLIRSGRELAGANCAYGGVRFESGVDENADGVLADAEVNAAQTSYVCNAAAAWRELPALPAVQTAYSFSLALGPDKKPRLGYMFQDAAYRQALLDQGGVLWDGGGVYTGTQVLGIYQLAAGAWSPYQGRLTPQSYRFSELVYSGNDSYYTTSYSPFGGLVSAIKNGQAGAYALTPAFTTRRAHSIGFLNGELYALIAQKTAGLTLSTFPAAQLGTTLNNLWTNVVQLAPNASSVVDPALVPAGDWLVAGYVLNGAAEVRATKTPGTLAAAADFTVLGGCDNAAQLDLAWDGSKLYRSCVDAQGALSIASTDPSVTPTVWSSLALGVKGAVADVELSTTAGKLVLAVRQGSAIRVYASATDIAPSFDAVLPGTFDVVAAADSITLAVADLTVVGGKLRTFTP